MFSSGRADGDARASARKTARRYFFPRARCLQPRPYLAADWRPGRGTESASNKKGKRKGCTGEKKKKKKKKETKEKEGGWGRREELSEKRSGKDRRWREREREREGWGGVGEEHFVELPR